MASGNWNRAWSGALSLWMAREIIALGFTHQGKYYKFITSSCNCMKICGSASVIGLEHYNLFVLGYTNKQGKQNR